MALLSKSDVEDFLRKLYPHGHPKFVELALEEIRLHSDKNHDYAFGGHPLGNFLRVSSILMNYPGLQLDTPVGVMISYLLKQLDAALWLMSQRHVTKTLETPTTRWMDVSVYSKLIECFYHDLRKKEHLARTYRASEETIKDLR